jgi:hypothetical protein
MKFQAEQYKFTVCFKFQVNKSYEHEEHAFGNIAFGKRWSQEFEPIRENILLQGVDCMEWT